MLALWQINSRNSPLTAEAKNVYFHGQLTDVAGMIVHPWSSLVEGGEDSYLPKW